MTKHQRPLVAKGGTSEYIYRELKSDMDAKRSFDDQEEDYAFSLFCEIRSNYIVAKLLGVLLGKKERNPLGLVVNDVMAIMIAADEDGLLLSKDPKFLRDWIEKIILSELDYFAKMEAYNDS